MTSIETEVKLLKAAGLALKRWRAGGGGRLARKALLESGHTDLQHLALRRDRPRASMLLHEGVLRVEPFAKYPVAFPKISRSVFTRANSARNRLMSICSALTGSGVLLQARLFPDMFVLVRQVHVACDFASGVCARLAGVGVTSHEAAEQSFADLHARIAKILACIVGLKEAQFADAAAREIIICSPTLKERRFNGRANLLHYGLPQFFFHVATAYAILPHNGVERGKQGYMGGY